MRAVYRLLGLVRRYGPDPVEAACDRALQLDVVSVTKIASMLERATEHTTPVLPTAAGAATARFARPPTELATSRTSTATAGTSPASEGTSLATSGTTALTLIPGGALDTTLDTEDALTRTNPHEESTQ